MDETAGQPNDSDLAALVAQLQVELATLRAENQQLKNRIKELGKKKNPTQRLDKSYSVKADHHEPVLPDDFELPQCRTASVPSGHRTSGVANPRRKSDARCL